MSHDHGTPPSTTKRGDLAESDLEIEPLNPNLGVGSHPAVPTSMIGKRICKRLISNNFHSIANPPRITHPSGVFLFSKISQNFLAVPSPPLFPHHETYASAKVLCSSNPTSHSTSKAASTNQTPRQPKSPNHQPHTCHETSHLCSPRRRSRLRSGLR